MGKRGITFLLSSMCSLFWHTLSTEAGSWNVTNPKPLQEISKRNHGPQSLAASKGQWPYFYTNNKIISCGTDLSQCQYLERFETLSRMTMQSVTSPNALKYSCKPSEIKRTRYKWVSSNRNREHVVQITVCISLQSLRNQAGFSQKYLTIQLSL